MVLYICPFCTQARTCKDGHVNIVAHSLLIAQGNVIMVGCKSPYSLYDERIASFEDDEGLHDQKDAAGFIKLQALRLRTLGVNRQMRPDLSNGASPSGIIEEKTPVSQR